MEFQNLYIFDWEVFMYDWLVVFKNADNGQYVEIHNDAETLRAFMEREPLLVGYNNKNYDQFVMKAAMSDFLPQEVKRVNDDIIARHIPGWQIPELKDCKVHFDQFDLMDDTQHGTGLKDIEGHLGMDITESPIPFDIDRPLSRAEINEAFRYCRHDVDATHILFKLRKVYIENKITLGREKGLLPAKALYMTNAKLTACYLDAKQKEHDDERCYEFPKDILWEYIPAEVKEFFDRIHDTSIPNEELWAQSIDIKVGECETRLGWGGIHGATLNYKEESTDERQIRNADVASFYPHLMTIDGYASRNIPSFKAYEDMLERRMEAKKSGNKSLANALKLVANTTYGAMLNEYNELYDPLMGRSVCITGQLRLLELANHLLATCPTLRVIQLNTDGIMCSFDNGDKPKWDAVLKEWQDRTGFLLEEDVIKKIVQKDVNNYVEVPFEGEPKIKGGALVRGVVTNGNVDFRELGFPEWKNLSGGAFKINNNAVVVSKAVVEEIVNGTPVEETIGASRNVLDFQIIAKTWSRSGNAFHCIGGDFVEKQRVNRVYASRDFWNGTLYMIDPNSNALRKVSGLPLCCIVDNDNRITMDEIDVDWYIRLAKRYVNDFYGIEETRDPARTRKVNKIKKQLLSLLEVN